MRRKENYPMRKLDVPKRVTLPNGRTFYARYERIKRQDLPANIRMKRTYKQRAARQDIDVGDGQRNKVKELFQL